MRGPVATLIDPNRLTRAWPFLAIAIAGQVSAAWPPGPADIGVFWLSAGFLALSAVLLLLPLPRRVDPLMFSACSYVFAVTFLMLATGGTGSGFGSLYFVSVVGVALYGSRRESVGVVTLVVAVLLVVSLHSGDPLVTVARRLVLLGGIAGVLSVSIHALRLRLFESNQRTVRLLHQAESINAAAAQLSSLLDPTGIAHIGAELAAQAASLPGPTPARARYVRIERGMARVDASHGSFEDDEVPSLEERTPLGRCVATREPVTGGRSAGAAIPFADGEPAGTVAWIPVLLGDDLHGVLEVVTPGGSMTDDVVERCVALGHLLELALSNWRAHEELEQAGRAEERRRIARDLHDGLAHELAFIASKARTSRRAGSQIDAVELAGAADRALDEARRAITVLSSSGPQSLVTAVTQTAEDLGARLGVPVRLDLAEGVDASGEVTEHVLRIVREAITNAATHGRPNCVTVSLRRDDGVRLTIADDGSGFDPQKIGGSGFGLLSMRERADAIGAGFVLASSPGRGSRVEVALP